MLPKVLIADGSDDFLLAMCQILQQRCQVLCCQDGIQTLALLRRESFGLLILDLMLPGLDGISLLETAISEGICPTILATTPLLNPYVQQTAERLHFGYLIRKPCDVGAVAARAEDLLKLYAPANPVQDGHQVLSRLLLSLGLSTKHDGYDYLMAAIPSYVANPQQAFTKELYPAIGKQFRRSGESVERSIRSALDAAWKLGDKGCWQQHFPNSSKRPTAAEFISRMAKQLRQQWE